jgi:nucleoid-associated protein YgaU
MNRFIILAALLLVACSRPPTEDVAAAEAAIDAARFAWAPDYAPEEFNSAEEALAEANELVDDGENERARVAANYAQAMAYLSIKRTREHRQQEALQNLADTVERALGTPASSFGPTRYEVVEGDCLWNISAKPVIYDDPWKWPVIYYSNRETIGSNPDLIYEGQVYAIPRW